MTNPIFTQVPFSCCFLFLFSLAFHIDTASFKLGPRQHAVGFPWNWFWEKHSIVCSYITKDGGGLLGGVDLFKIDRLRYL